MDSVFCFRLLRAASVAATLAVALMALTTIPADAANADAETIAEVGIIKMQFEP